MTELEQARQELERAVGELQRVWPDYRPGLMNSWGAERLISAVDRLGKAAAALKAKEAAGQAQLDAVAALFAPIGEATLVTDPNQLPLVLRCGHCCKEGHVVEDCRQCSCRGVGCNECCGPG